MSEYDQLVDMIKDLEINHKINMKDAEYIGRNYPDAFYKKVYDNNKIKVYTKGKTTKVYVYPHFKPRTSNHVVNCIEQSYQHLKLTNACWDKINDNHQVSIECKQLSLDLLNKSNECFKNVKD